MGWSFRKSIKAGPVRINLSKSGVGYSIGVGGIRFTKWASKRKKKAESFFASIIGTILGIILALFFLMAIAAALWTLFVRFKWVIIAVVAVAVAGAVTYFAVARKRKGEAATDPLPKQTEVFTCEVAGLSFHMDNLMSMMIPNYLYSYRKQELIDTCNVDVNIYKQTIEDKQVELLPDPQNPYDPNAIRVLLGGEMIGYIPADSCAHVLDLIQSGRIISIAYTVQGGIYKCVSEDYDSIKDKSTYSMESGEDDYSVTLYIREAMK